MARSKQVESGTQPFVIVAGLRTGSTLLSTSLDRHPSIRCYGEVFHERDFADNQVAGCDRHRLLPEALLARMLRPGAGPRTIGFRAMLAHPSPRQVLWTSLWRDLARLHNLRVIHLQRRDLLAQYASLMIANLTGVYHPSPREPAPKQRPRIWVDPQEFRRWVAQEVDLRRRREHVLRAHPSLWISYEDLADAWTATIHELLAFLGAVDVAIPQSRSKQESRPLEQVIVNYDQVVAATGGSTALPAGT